MEEKYTEREIIRSGDGSHTLYLPLLNETYHSRHGAITESLYVFIEKGLNAMTGDNIKIFEVGFGTGLNAWLTLHEAAQKTICYHSIEAYPLQEKEYTLINYSDEREYPEGRERYLQLHKLAWDEEHTLSPYFHFKKIHQKLEHYQVNSFDYDLIYYDAYGPGYQPDMWDAAHFEKMYLMLKEGGVLVSYCCSGVFKRALKAAHFEVNKIAGPPGKREMVVAKKK